MMKKIKILVFCMLAFASCTEKKPVPTLVKSKKKIVAPKGITTINKQAVEPGTEGVFHQVGDKTYFIPTPRYD